MKRVAAGVSVLIALWAMWGLWGAGTEAAANPATPEYYTTQVQPILRANCYRCHAGFNHRGGLSLQTPAGIRKGGRDGAVVVPGDPAKSLLLRLIRHEGPANDPRPMPPKSPRLSDADIATITRWIQAGAIMPPERAKP